MTAADLPAGVMIRGFTMIGFPPAPIVHAATTPSPFRGSCHPPSSSIHPRGMCRARPRSRNGLREGFSVPICAVTCIWAPMPSVRRPATPGAPLCMCPFPVLRKVSLSPSLSPLQVGSRYPNHVWKQSPDFPPFLPLFLFARTHSRWKRGGGGVCLHKRF